MARVLVVDDAMFMRASIQKMLEANGHTLAAEAEDGREALKKYEEVQPDVVILDITMPGMNGLEVLRKMKKLDPAAKIIICSAIGYQATIAEAIECGAKDFIVKPFEASQLIAAIEKVMNSKK